MADSRVDYRRQEHTRLNSDFDGCDRKASETRLTAFDFFARTADRVLNTIRGLKAEK